ncbi:conserved hypothetical protein [Ricinus communis]|uniref:Uncharacterized protein n=1 Tax=Ricinus communis TaxID=3988 RepID=B9TFG7_RICCO|nr:conserved hypothetical protein [Ricinus communis]
MARRHFVDHARQRLLGAGVCGERRITIAGQGLQLGFQRRDPPRQFRYLVHDHDPGHDGQPEIADLTELALQMHDITVEAIGEIRQMVFLALFAGHPVGFAVDRYRYLCHSTFRSLPHCDGCLPRDQRSSTALMVSIAVTSRRDTSRLTSSSRFARNSA